MIDNLHEKYLIKNMKMTALHCAITSKIGSSRKVARKIRGSGADGHRRESIEKNAADDDKL